MRAVIRTDATSVEERWYPSTSRDLPGTRRRNNPSCPTNPINGLDGCDSTRRGSGGATFITMMEPVQFWDRHDPPPGFWCLDRPWLGGVLLQAQVRTTPMIIVRESL